MIRLKTLLFLAFITLWGIITPGTVLGLDANMVTEAVKNLIKQAGQSQESVHRAMIKSDTQLRKTPTVFSETGGRLNLGQPVIIMDREGDWVHVKLEDGRSGWVHRDTVTDLRPGETSKEPAPTETAPPAPSEKRLPQAPPDTAVKNEMIIKSHNGTMSVNFLNVDIREALSAIALEREINISTSKDVSGTITVHLFDVGLEEALGAMAMAGGFKYQKQGDLYYIYKPKKEIDPEVRDLELRTIKLKYADGKKVMEALKNIEGVRKVELHEPTGTIIMEDTHKNIEKLETLINHLDRLPRQVMIEAKILEITLTDDMAFGINWNTILSNDTIRLGTGGFSSAIQPETAPISPVPTSGTGLYANMIASAGTQKQFSAALDILQTKTRVNTLSTPKILAIHGKPAKVQVGGQQGYKVTTTNVGVATETIQFIDTGTILDITPYIDDDGNILLNVKPSINSAKIEEGIPVVSSTAVSTWLLAKNGETIFIGGLIQDTQTKSREMIPCLGGIPGLGVAFGRTLKGSGKSELVVLITPKIIEPDHKGEIYQEAVKKARDLEDNLKRKENSALRRFWDFFEPVK